MCSQQDLEHFEVQVEDGMVTLPLAKKRHQITQKFDVSRALGLVASVSKTSLYGLASSLKLSIRERCCHGSHLSRHRWHS